MSDLRQLRLARWERIKQRGMARFVLVYGVLIWGVGFGIIFSLAHLLSSEPLPLPWYCFVPLFFGLSLLGGIFVGLCLWLAVMWNYSRALKAKD